MSKPKSGEFEDVITMDDKHIAIAEVMKELLSEDEATQVMVQMITKAEHPEAMVKYIVELANDTIFRDNKLEAFYNANGELI